MGAPVGIWELIDGLLRTKPFTVQAVDALLGSSLQLDASDSSLLIYRGSGAALADGSELVSSELRLQRDDPAWPGFILIRIRGRCISMEEVNRHFPSLQYTDVPRGRSEDEVTALSTYGPWGKLNFMFPVRDRDCVRAISIDPTARPS